jgi:hypothetical protein
VANRLKTNPIVIDSVSATDIIKNPRVVGMIWQNTAASNRDIAIADILTIKAVDQLGNAIGTVFEHKATAAGVGDNIAFSEPWCPGDLNVTAIDGGELYLFLA